MSIRFTQKIKRHKLETSVVILSAGGNESIKAHEPRALLNIGSKTLIEHQLSVVESVFDDCDLIVVIGIDGNKVAKKINNKIRLVENQLHSETNSFESLRLAVNNSVKDGLLFFHGDLYFNIETLKELDYSQSFLVIDNKQQLKSREVGATVVDNEVTILSYGLPTKWAQIAYFTGKELEHLRAICLKNKPEYKSLLTFEVINLIIDKKGKFLSQEPPNMSILEIDNIKDLRNENFNM